MKIIIKCGGRWKDDKRANQLLNKEADYMRMLLPALAADLCFKLPAKLILRPLYYSGLGSMAGRFNYVPGKGYSIALHIEACKRTRNRSRNIIDHECAHLANIMLHKDWGHGEKFKKMKSVCFKLRPQKSSKAKAPKSF